MKICPYERKCPGYYSEDLKCSKMYDFCQLYKFREDLKERGLLHLVETQENDMLPEEIE